MSSCADSCSTCCRRASCASATSDSSPTANELLCCRCACNCSADYSRRPLPRHHRPPMRLTHSGTARSAEEPCASSNGSPPPNSCFALHLNQTGAQHEALSTSSAFDPCFGTYADSLSLQAKTPWMPASPASTSGLSEPTCSSIPPFSHRTMPNSVCA